MNNNTDNHVEIDVDVTQKDLGAFLKKYMRALPNSIYSGRKIIWTILKFLFTCMLLLAAFALSISLFYESVEYTVLYVLFAITLMWGYIELEVTGVVNEKTRIYDENFEAFTPLFPATNGKMRFSFGTKGFSLRGAGETMVFNYDEVEKVIETKAGLLICFEETKFLCLPARFFDSDSAFKVTSLLQDAMMEFYIRKRLMKLPKEPEKPEVKMEKSSDIACFFSLDEWRDAQRNRRKIDFVSLFYFLIFILLIPSAILVWKCDLRQSIAIMLAYNVLNFLSGFLYIRRGRKKYKEYYRGAILHFEEKEVTVKSVKTGKEITYSGEFDKKYEAYYGLVIYKNKDHFIYPSRKY